MKTKRAALCLIVIALAVLASRGYGMGRKRQADAVCLTVRVRPVFASRPLRFNDLSLRNKAGNTLSVSRLAFFVSGVSLLRADGAAAALDGQVAYLNPEEGRDAFTFHDVPAGRYVGLRFCIGLPASINHADPALYPAAHPLHPLVNHLHWGWQGGYVFLALEGRYSERGGRASGYVYHLATDANLMTITLTRDMEITADSRLDLDFDLARVFDAVSRIAIRPEEGSDSTHSARGDALAARLKTNAEHAFAISAFSRSDGETSTDTKPADVGMTAAPALTQTPQTHVPAGKSSPRATPYAFPAPPHFPRPLLPADNPLTYEGIALGKKLFFEKRLSGDNSQSCADCHQPRYAFTNGGKAFSRGIDGRPGTRRAMPLFNLAWSHTFTWDGRRTRLRNQVLAPIQDAREMHQSLPHALAKLRADHAYPALFARAFGNPAITAKRLGLAVEQYLYTIISADSKFDRALSGAARFTDEEKRGLLLFITEYDAVRGQRGADCFHCHGGNLFTDYAFKNNGLDSAFKDVGRGGITHSAADTGKFKTPSLRNVELTGPYMHDGRFATLEAVIAHYNAGAHRSDTLDPNIAKHPEDGIRLSSADQRALVAFLKTLTEERWRHRKITR